MKDLAEDLYDGQVLQKLFGEKGVEGCGGELGSAGGWSPTPPEEPFSAHSASQVVG